MDWKLRINDTYSAEYSPIFEREEFVIDNLCACAWNDSEFRRNMIGCKNWQVKKISSVRLVIREQCCVGYVFCDLSKYDTKNKTPRQNII